jgi:hypothetical protein
MRLLDSGMTVTLWAIPVSVIVGRFAFPAVTLIGKDWFCERTFPDGAFVLAFQPS